MATHVQHGYARPPRTAPAPRSEGIDTIVRTIVIIGCVTSFVLSPPSLLALLGWSFGDTDGEGYQKFHPATYVFLLAAITALLSLKEKYWNIIRSWSFGPFLAVVAALIGWAVVIQARSSASSGVIGTAVTSFLTPALVLISFPALTSRDCRRVALFIRAFIILNAVIGILEALTHITVLPLNQGEVWRSGGLFGHPLLSSLMTGMMIIYMLSTSKRRWATPRLMAEVGLYVIALFAFGSRTSLALVPIVLMIGALLPSGRAGRSMTPARRLGLLLLLVAGASLTLLPIDFVQNALGRFGNDAGSADTRTAALEIFLRLDHYSMLWGIDVGRVLALQSRFGTDVAIEAAWIALTLRFGLVLVLPLMVTMGIALFVLARLLDRSAGLVILYFLIVTAGSVAFATKSMTICELMVFILTLCQPADPNRTPASRGAPRAATFPS